MYKTGDKSRALCERCAKLVTTTFAVRNVPFGDTDRVVENILVAACDDCGEVVAVPSQCTPAIRQVAESL